MPRRRAIRNEALNAIDFLTEAIADSERRNSYWPIFGLEDAASGLRVRESKPVGMLTQRGKRSSRAIGPEHESTAVAGSGTVRSGGW